MDIKEYLISDELSVLQTMEQLDKVAKKVLFVTTDGRLVATVTDGDIRRLLLNKGSLEDNVMKAANHNPKSLKSCSRKQALKFMKENSVSALPLVDDSGKIENIVFWDDSRVLTPKEKVDIPVVMMAGGLGTRLYPYTKILPKPLIPVGDVPIAEQIINRFHSFGSNKFYLIVNHKKNMIKAYFNEIERDYDVEYADEEVFLGTGGGLSLLKGKINTPFILTNCDILIMEDISKIYKHHKEQGNIITMVCSLKNYTIPYGVVEIGENGEIGAMKEKPTMSFFTNTGCYIVEPEVINELEDNVCIGFPDVVEKYKKQGKKVGVFPISESDWLDMGQLDELENMKQRLGV